MSYAVAVLSRFCPDVRKPHWRAALDVLRYLKGTVRLGLSYDDNDGDPPLAFADAGVAILDARLLEFSLNIVGLQLCGSLKNNQLSLNRLRRLNLFPAAQLAVKQSGCVNSCTKWSVEWISVFQYYPIRL